MKRAKKPAPQLVVVTGAGSGIGRATAERFAKMGARVIVSDIDLDAAERTVDLIQEAGGRAHAYRIDVSNIAEWDALAVDVRNRYGVADVLVNNAGIGMFGDFLGHSVHDWERLLGVDLMGVIHGCSVIGRQMVARGRGGHIVNVASAAAFLPSRSTPAYCTAKAGVLMLSEVLRVELAEHQIGVTVICPTVVKTNIAAKSILAGVSEERSADFAKSGASVWGRYARTSPEQIAKQITRSVRFNWAVVPVNADAWLIYLLRRASPALVRSLGGQLTADRMVRGADWLANRIARASDSA